MLFGKRKLRSFCLILLLHSLRHDEEEKRFFHLVITFTIAWLTEKVFFKKFKHYVQYAMVTGATNSTTQRLWKNILVFISLRHLLCKYQGRIQRFWKGVALYAGHHSWPTNEILGFRRSKRAKMTLETIKCWQNISISIFSNFLHFYIQWKPANEILSIFQNLQTLWQRKRKSTYTAVNGKRKIEESWAWFYNRLFFIVL